MRRKTCDALLIFAGAAIAVVLVNAAPRPESNRDPAQRLVAEGALLGRTLGLSPLTVKIRAVDSGNKGNGIRTTHDKILRPNGMLPVVGRMTISRTRNAVQFL
jgi:hypothetical protein